MHPSPYAGVVKLVDTLDLGSSASRRGGSSPFTRTQKKPQHIVEVFYFTLGRIITLPLIRLCDIIVKSFGHRRVGWGRCKYINA